MTKPLLVIVAAPSGTGKSTLCDRLMGAFEGIVYSVSCTTRQPRGREKHGIDYYFLSDDEFAQKVAAGEFLEHAEVHGHKYGTLRRTVADAMRQGHSVLMDIDVQGVRQVREKCRAPETPPVVRDGYVDIFISPPSLQELRRRLECRGEDSAEVIERRMQNAAGEMACAEEFKYNIINDDLEQAFAELLRVLRAEAGIGEQKAESRDRYERT